MNFTWQAIYYDGTIINSIDENSNYVNSDSLDNNRIERFSLLKDSVTVYNLHLKHGQRLVYRKRVKQSSGNEHSEICHIIGLRQNIQNQLVQSISFYFENTGIIDLLSSFEENHQWFYSPQLRLSEI